MIFCSFEQNALPKRDEQHTESLMMSEKVVDVESNCEDYVTRQVYARLSEEGNEKEYNFRIPLNLIAAFNEVCFCINKLEYQTAGVSVIL